MGAILVGTASWTDKTLIASGWYPPEADTPEKRLRFYARQFGLVEVDATYYALPAEQTATSWAERTPAGFTFNVKAFSLFTQHPTPVKAMPLDLREAVAGPDSAAAGKERVYLKDVDPGVVDQAWERFLAALEPLRQAGKLGAILLQFPPWFPIGRSRKDYILACASRVAPRRVCVEFRNKTWMSPENQEETLGFLASHQIPYVCVDMPQGYPSSIPPVLAATSDLAVVRMHGHSDKWDSKNIYERFGYEYSEGELASWAPRIRDLASGASTTHVLFNNCYRNYAQVNAQQLEKLLLHDDLEGEPGRAAAADERGDLVPVVNREAAVIVSLATASPGRRKPSPMTRRRPRREATFAYQAGTAGRGRAPARAAIGPVAGGPARDRGAGAARTGRELCHREPVPPRDGHRRHGRHVHRRRGRRGRRLPGSHPGGVPGGGLHHQPQPQSGRPPVVASFDGRHLHRDRDRVGSVQRDGDQDLAGARLLRAAPERPGRRAADLHPEPGLVLVELRGAPGVLRAVRGVHHRG
jgi:uncharacterized protein YecE (DUF72 family)